MAILTKVERIDLTQEPDPANAIVDTCDIMAAYTPPLRLAGCFESHGQLVLVFQS